MAPTEVEKNSTQSLRVHLLGTVTLDEVIRLQRSLIYKLGGGEDCSALLLCEHPPMITVGRHGGAAALPFLRDLAAARGIPVRWVARGGGAILHLPGQLGIYPILPLRRLGLDISKYLCLLKHVLLDTLDDFGIRGESRLGEEGLWVGERRIASVGVAMRLGVTTFGIILNIDPDLTVYRGLIGKEMTSVARERHGPVRPQLVRQRLVEHFSALFQFERVDLAFAVPNQPGHERLTVSGRGQTG